MNAPIPNDLIPISEAAELMDVSVDTLRRWDESGKLVAFKSQGGHRLYSRRQAMFFANDLYKMAFEWAASVPVPLALNPTLYCEDQPMFQARLTKMQNILLQSESPDIEAIFSLVVAVAGEIGNNSFDHNSGYWPDVRGIFFGYNLPKRQVVLADRGQGILRTLSRVRPNLKNDREALWVAFTEVVSGREPEKRGNGLKFVKSVVTGNEMTLSFQTGNAKTELKHLDTELNIAEVPEIIRGCIALITY